MTLSYDVMTYMQTIMGKNLQIRKPDKQWLDVHILLQKSHFLYSIKNEFACWSQKVVYGIEIDKPNEIMGYSAKSLYNNVDQSH